MNVPLLDPTKNWECPSCGAQHVTKELRPHVPMHPCKGLRGILAPYVEVLGLELDRHKQRHVLVDREDYVGNEIVRRDATGRPWMAIDTERADGSNDRHVFVPTAQRDPSIDPRRIRLLYRQARKEGLDAAGARRLIATAGIA